MDKFSRKIELEEGINDVILNEHFKYIKGFCILNFQNLNEYHCESHDNEIGLLILEGTCDIEINGEEHKNLGLRKSVFAGKPTGVYIAIDSSFSIKSQDAKIAICKGKCFQKSTSAVIKPEIVKVMNVGKDNWSREVRIIVGPDSPSVNLLIGETINPPGNWSGIPPAKHEKENLPDESLHEELYYFKSDRPQGWGIERIYSPNRNINELVYLEENTVTFMPWGYHEVAAAPGYTLYYLFFLAGEGNKLAQFEDPDHNWIKDV